MRDKTIEAGEAARDEQQKVEDLYEAYQKANKEYLEDASKKGELVAATDNLLQALGEEGRQIRDLKQDYVDLGEAIDNVIISRRIQAVMKLKDAVSAQRDTLNAKFGKTSQNVSGYDGVEYSPDNVVDQRLASMISEAVASAVIEGAAERLQKDTSYYGIADTLDFSKKLFNIGISESPEQRYQDLIAASDAITEALKDKLFSPDEVHESSIYKFIQEQIAELEPEIGKLNDLIGETNAEATRLVYQDFVKQNKIPETFEAYRVFRDNLLREAQDSGYFEGAAEDIEKAVDAYLGALGKFESFRGFNGFKEAFKSLDKTVRDAIMNMIKYGDNLTDEQVKALKEWADQYKYSVDDIIQNIKRLGAEEVHNNPTLDNIADLATLRDELAKTSKAWEAYNKILEGGDKGDAAKQMASAYQKAIEDIDVGRIDTKAVWGAAKLLFSDQQLAAMKYDLVEIAKELRSPMMEALFGAAGEDEDDYEIGVRFANYIKAHSAQLESAGAHILDQGDGKFQFWYDSLGKLAKSLGMSEEALTSLLDALDAYGVQSMRSTEETNQLRDQYLELFNAVDNTGTVAERTAKAVQKLIDAMFAKGMNEHEISDVLTLLSNSGVIAQDVDTLNAEIAEAAKNLDDVDQSNATPTVDANTTPANTALDNLWNRLNELATTTTEHDVVVNEVQGTTLSDGTQTSSSHGTVRPGTRTPGHASGTQNAPAGPALVNEKGPELISDNGVAYIANGGKPGFVNLGKGAVVFNAEDTKKIFSRGYSNIPVKAFASGTGNTVNKASLRERLISGKKTRGLYTAVAVFRCKNPRCDHSWEYDPISYPKGPTATCPKCGWRYEFGEVVGKSAANPDYLGTEYPYDTGGYEYNQDTGDYDPRPGNAAYESYHNCANCGRVISERYDICPYCGESAWYKKQSIYSIQDTDTSKAKPINTRTGSNTKPGGSSGYTGGGGGNYVGGADYGSQAEPEKVDWIAVAINRIQKAVADLEKVASSGFKKLSTRLNAAKKQVSELTKEIAAQEQGYDRYMAEAAGVGLGEDIAQLVRDGTIDIREYDEETRKLIDAYSEWYEKALDCKSAVEELHQEIADLYMDMFNNTQTDFENRLSEIEHKATMVNKGIEMTKAQGYLDSVEFYKELANIEQENLGMLQAELGGLTAAFQEAMNSGEIEEGSEAWFEMRGAILSVEEAIADANIQLVKYQKTMRSIEWSYFDYAQERFGQLQQEANFLIELMSNDKLFEKNGQITGRGNATMGLHVMNYNAYMVQADAYAEEMLRISKELAENPYDTELIARRETLLGLQQQSIIAAENEKNAIKDLVAKGIQLELSSLKELITEYEKSLDSAKSLYDYQKSITDKAETVAKLQKQVAAYGGDDSEENIARMQKLNEDLKKAQEDLAETEMEHNISERKKLLDELYNDYERYLNERLDDIEALVQEVIGSVNASADAIESTLHSAADEVGYTITDGMSEVLSGGSYAYYDKMFTGVTSVNGYLASIEKYVADLVAAANAAARSSISSGASGLGGVPGVGSTRYDNPNMRLGEDEYLLSFDEPIAGEGYKLKVSEDELYNIVGDDYANVISRTYGSSDPQSIADFNRVIQELESKYPDKFAKVFRRYSAGGLADYTGLAMLHGSSAKPELVLNADDTEKFLAAAKLMRTPVLNALLDKDFRLPELGGGVGGGITIENFAVDFNLENATSYDDILREAQADKRFERLITSITSDVYVSGKSKLNKFRQKI